MNYISYLSLTVISAGFVQCNVGPLFPFGSTTTDQQFQGGDDDIFSITLANPFDFYGTQYSEVYFVDNGGLSFASNSLLGKQPSFEVDTRPAVLVFQNDHDAGLGDASFFARDSNEPSDLTLADTYTEELFPDLAPYGASSVVVVTWDRFEVLRGAGFPFVNTFQAALVSSNQRPPVVLTLYGEITDNLGDIVVGVNAGDGVNFEELPESRNSTLALQLDTTPQRPGLTLGLRGFKVDPKEGGSGGSGSGSGSGGKNKICRCLGKKRR